MKNKKTTYLLHAGIALGILFLLTMPISIVIAIDTTSPVIQDPAWDPAFYVGPLDGSYLLVDVTVTDNVAVADVRLVVNGPGGFYSNESCYSYGSGFYEGFIYPLPSYGTYASHVWAVDTSGNQVVSPVFYSLILQDTIPYVHVAAGSPFPWDGSPAHPFPTINMGLTAASPGGTVFVHNGLYRENIMPGTVNLIGESKENVILTGATGEVGTVQLNGASTFSMMNFTIKQGNSSYSNIFFSTASNKLITHCIIRDSTYSGDTGGCILYMSSSGNMISNCDIRNNNIGIFFYSQSEDATVYHDNFISNAVNVIFNSPSPSLITIWDNGTTGNFWDNYRIRYPGATINSTSGTWNIPYAVVEGIGIYDYHPWVYRDGYIDHTPPSVTVTYPNGGETVNGVIIIQWTAADDHTTSLNGRIRLDYSGDNGGTWHMIASGIYNAGAYLWNTTTVPDGNHYLIRVNATDEFNNIGSDVSNNVFTIYNNPNHPPTVPSNPNPANGATNVGLNTNLSWTGGDPDGGDTVLYDVYFGTTSTPPKVSSNQSAMSYMPSGLTYNTPYYWKIISWDNHGATTQGLTWSFTTVPNSPPYPPAQPSGPTTGFVNITYMYSTNTTDPNNNQVYYKWSWGNEESAWMGPYASGVTVSASHVWTAPGTFDVKVKAKDTSDAESDWSTPLAVTITEVQQQQPNLTVENFKGGFGLSAVVTNTGDAPATNVTWSIVLDGKFIFKGKNSTGMILSIEPNSSATIKTGLILGFGKTNIMATATCDEGATYTEDGSAFILLFFVVRVKEPLP